MPEPATYGGTVAAIVFRNEENLFTVARLDTDQQGLITVVGTLAAIFAGDRLEVMGEWVDDRRYGRQLKVVSAKVVLPTSVEGIERFLASGPIKGLGPALAARVVGKFGESTLDVIDRDPQRLLEVEGIGPKRLNQVLDVWKHYREIKDIMAFLQGYGISAAYAHRIIKTWGHDAAARLRQNPYLLAREISGIGFKKADEIAVRLGIRKDSAVRLENGLLHALRESTERGHVFVPRHVLMDTAAHLLDVSPEDLNAALQQLQLQQAVMTETDTGGEPSVYPPRLYRAELRAARRIWSLLSGQVRRPPDPQSVKAVVQSKLQIDLSREQLQAVVEAMASPVLVITGGPGTGKTTIVRAIIALKESRQLTCRLCAPTGRAAQRLQAATGRAASTIHRLLEYKPQERRFNRNADNPLPADVVVLDEVSMVDIVLFASLLDALADGTQLILVGDADQLPSVGPGRVLGDLIDSKVLPVVRLTRIYRQASRSLIVRAAHQINHGKIPKLEPTSQLQDCYFIERSQPEDVLRTLEKVVLQRIPKSFGLRPIEDIQILTPMYKGEVGAVALNSHFQQLLNPAGDQIARGDVVFRVGDKVLQVRNNYEKEIYNGDVGRVVTVERGEGRLTVCFDGRNVPYDLEELDELKLGYAISVHKSQGSEYPAVVIPLHQQHAIMLRRNLIYTAVTRARRLVVMVGSRKALQLSVMQSRVEERFCSLHRRIQQSACSDAAVS